MNDHSCCDENRELWDTVVAAYSGLQDSVCGEFLGMREGFVNLDHVTAPLPSSDHAVDAGAHTNKVRSSKNPVSLQRDIMAVLKSAPPKSSLISDIPAQLAYVIQESYLRPSTPSEDLNAGPTPSGWSLAEVANLKTLLLREDVLRATCDHAALLDLGPLLPAVAAVVVLPTVSQAAEPLSHPTVVSVCILATQDLHAFTTACFAPALKYSASPHCAELLAKVLRQMGAKIWPYVHLLMRALSERDTVAEHHLAVLEAVCAICPPNPQSDVIESLAAALQHATSSQSSRSSRVGRTLLTAVSALAPHLHRAAPAYTTLAQIVEAHESPLQRAVFAQLKRVP